MEEEFFHSFPGFLSNAIAVCHPVTQVSVTHVGCVVFDDEWLYSFPTLPEDTVCRWNRHIERVMNFSFVLPTDSP
jgi:hypothetical protein